jgi:hypothetical protein
LEFTFASLPCFRGTFFAAVGIDGGSGGREGGLGEAGAVTGSGALLDEVLEKLPFVPRKPVGIFGMLFDEYGRVLGRRSRVPSSGRLSKEDWINEAVIHRRDASSYSVLVDVN